MYKWYQVLVQDLGENMDENLAQLTQKDWRFENVTATELNCKVVKKGQPSHFNPPPPPPRQVIPFLEGGFWLCMMYGSGDMEHNRHNFLTICDHFLPFYSHNNLENQNFEKKKKKCLAISSFYNRAPQMTITWCTVSKIMSATHWILPLFYLSSLFFICHFTSLTTQKITVLKKGKEFLEKKIPSLYTSVPKIMIICYAVPEIWHLIDVTFIFHFGLFSTLLPL